MAFEQLEARGLYSGTAAGKTIALATSGNVGEYNSVAVDPLTKLPAVAFYDATHDNLEFTQQVGKTWKTVTVDSVGDVGEYASLKFDAKGNPWIAYYDATNADLKLARRVGTKWSTQTVDSTGSQGEYASLALTKAGLPLIAYRGQASNGDVVLRLATDTTTGWSTQTVDDPTQDGIYGTAVPGDVLQCSLALDANDRPRIAYQELNQNGGNFGTGYYAEYASDDANGWNFSGIQSEGYTGDTGFSIDLVLDTNGFPHVSFTAPYQDDGTYGSVGAGVTYDADYGFGWVGENVDTNISEGESTTIESAALLLKSNGQPIVAYSTGDIALGTGASNKFTDDGAGSSKNIGSNLSIAQNSNGVLYVAFYNPKSDDLELFTES